MDSADSVEPFGLPTFGKLWDILHVEYPSKTK